MTFSQIQFPLDLSSGHLQMTLSKIQFTLDLSSGQNKITLEFRFNSQ
jgi:hypothetical protein